MDFSFPPAEVGTWRVLDEAGKQEWLRARNKNYFGGKGTRTHREGRVGDVFTIDGRDVADLPAFFCAIGEAINGPGGYFGSGMTQFDDCLFGKFGLEAPCRIVWKNSKVSMGVLDAQTLARHCEEGIEWIDAQEDAHDFAEGRAWFVETLALATNGQRTMFDEIVSTIRSIPSRHLAKSDWTIELKLE